MKSGKRILAGILSAIMILSSTQLPGVVSYAEELQPVQENLQGEESPAQEDVPEQEPGQDQEGVDEKQEQPGVEAPADTSGENGESKEDNPAQTETPAEEEQPSDQEAEEPEETLPVEGEDEGNPDEAVDENEETDAELSEEDVTVSENDLQISGNDLMSVGETEVWADAEIEGAYQFGGAPSEQDAVSAYSISAYSESDVEEYLYQ